MKKKIAIPVAAGLLLFGGGVAFASIPASDGTIKGCYKNNGGDLKVVDSAAPCPSGYTQLNWSQTGPQGPAGQDGVSGIEVVQASEAVGPGSGNTVSVVAYCPSGKKAIGGGAQVPVDQDPDVSWALQYVIPDTEASGWVGQARRYGGESTNTGSIAVRIICATVG